MSRPCSFLSPFSKRRAPHLLFLGSSCTRTHALARPCMRSHGSWNDYRYTRALEPRLVLRWDRYLDLTDQSSEAGSVSQRVTGASEYYELYLRFNPGDYPKTRRFSRYLGRNAGYHPVSAIMTLLMKPVSVMKPLCPRLSANALHPREEKSRIFCTH